MSTPQCAPIFLLTLCCLVAAPAGADLGLLLDHSWRVGSGPVGAVAFAPGADWFSVAAGREVVLLEPRADAAPRRLRSLGPARKEVSGVAVSPDGEIVAVVDLSGGLALYAADSGARLASVPGAHSKRALSVGFTVDGSYVLSGGTKGEARVWTPRGQRFAEVAPVGDADVVRIVGIGPGRRALTVGADGDVTLWDVDTQSRIRPSLMEMDILSADLAAGSGLLALGLQELSGNLHRSSPVRAREIRATDLVRLVDAAKGIRVRDLEGGDQDLDAVAVSPDGRFVAAGGSAGTARIWSVESGDLITQVPLDAPLTALGFSPDGERLVAGTRAGGVSLFALEGVGAAPAAAGPEIIIVILEPEELVGAPGRGLLRVAGGVRGRSLKVTGRVRSPARLGRLEVGGREITSIVAEEDDSLRFTAFVPLRRPGSHRVEIVAENEAGGRATTILQVEKVASEALAPSGAARRLALIVGISDYADDSIDLDYADDDARALHALLTDPALGPARFRPEDVMLLVNGEATVDRINIGLRQFVQSARDDDFVLFFFAGHGVPDPNRLSDFYLLAHDSDPESIAGTGLLMRHVREAIASIPARDVLILADACHGAGIAAPASMRSLTTNPIHEAFLEGLRHTAGGLGILTASEAAQLSVEGDRWQGHGVFTWFLLEGLRGSADADGDRLVSLGEIMEYVRENVKRETRGRQIPAIGPTSFDRERPLVVVGPG